MVRLEQQVMVQAGILLERHLEQLLGGQVTTQQFQQAGVLLAIRGGKLKKLKMLLQIAIDRVWC